MDVNPAYHLKHLTDENGLPQNSIKAIVPDTRGNIWLATERGLVRYDGRSCVTFDDFGTLYSDRNITSFHINPGKSNQYFFARNGGDSFIRISKGKATIDTATFNNELRVQPFVRQRGNIGYLTEGLTTLFEWPASRDHYINPTGSDSYFICDREQVEYYAKKKKVSVFRFKSESYWNFFRLNNQLYYLQKNQKIARFEGGSHSDIPKEARLTGDILKHPLYESRQGSPILWNNCSNQAFIFLGRSLYFLRSTEAGDLATDLILDEFDFDGADISFPNILNAYYDRATGRIFLGSNVSGLYILERKPFKTHTADLKGRDNVYYDNIYYGQTALSQQRVLTAQGAVFNFASKTRFPSVG